MPTDMTSSRRENVTAKRETKPFPVFGDKNGLGYLDWCSDVHAAMEQVCEEANLITERFGSFGGQLRRIGRDRGRERAVGPGATPLHLDASADQTGEGFQQGRDGKGDRLGATTVKRLQIEAELTQHRILELADAVSHPKKAKSYDFWPNCGHCKGRFAG